MYGSSLRLVTRTPREARIAASDAAAMPFPNEETTPPVTNTNLVMDGQFRKFVFYRNASRSTKRAVAVRAVRCAHLRGLQRRSGEVVAQPCRHSCTRGFATDEFEHGVD